MQAGGAELVVVHERGWGEDVCHFYLGGRLVSKWRGWGGRVLLDAEDCWEVEGLEAEEGRRGEGGL